jgi:alanine racemase
MNELFSFSEWPSICEGRITQQAKDRVIEWLVTDSRKPVASETAVFFAIRGQRHDGHRHVHELYRAGVRQFVVETDFDAGACPEANFFQTPSAVAALQQLAAWHRSRFTLPVLAITGSNGKTIIKEWLFQLLAPGRNIIKNPGSYNSQVGVPLSVWAIRRHHQLGIFEAGISLPGEMKNLARVIQPTLGLFTNLGPAHDEGFASRTQKLHEKLDLFASAKAIVYCRDQHAVAGAINQRFGATHELFSWGAGADADVQITRSGALAGIRYRGLHTELRLRFNDAASTENLFHCIAVMVYLGVPLHEIAERIASIEAVPMRLELKQGIQNSLLIDDSYNNDLAGLRISLDFLHSQSRPRKTLILSDLLQTGLTPEGLVAQLEPLFAAARLHRLVGIGPFFMQHADAFAAAADHTAFFPATAQFLTQFDFRSIDSEAMLVKGARPFQFEHIVQRLQQKVHGTVMEINLGALVANLNFFKSKLKPGVKLMAMVKAFAYGSGSEQVAHLLQYHKVNYLGVAYADEGVELRKNGISLPIMVMNPTEAGFDLLLRYSLEPEVYALRMLDELLSFLQHRPLTIHLEVDTGMRRLGFDADTWPQALQRLKNHPEITIASVMSHLAAADEARHDAFTHRQVQAFDEYYRQLVAELGIRPPRQLLNSPGILRFPQYQYDMVRLGIGLYGINPTQETVNGLQPVVTLKTVVSQIKTIPKGDSVGYGRQGLADTDKKIATIAIGYADGFSRAFSRGQGVVWINGRRAPVIGNVCMDMTMVDVTGLAVEEGDEVIIFGGPLPIEEVAGRIQTIPYEILTNTSERVKRVFHTES